MVAESKPLPAASDTIPTLIAARYEVLAVLGRGGVGVVYRVRDHHDGRALALKRLSLARGSRQTLAALFEREYALRFRLILRGGSFDRSDRYRCCPRPRYAILRRARGRFGQSNRVRDGGARALPARDARAGHLGTGETADHRESTRVLGSGGRRGLHRVGPSGRSLSRPASPRPRVTGSTRKSLYTSTRPSTS